MIETITCPYCNAECESTNEAKYFNGVKPIEPAEGCEFCNPSEGNE